METVDHQLYYYAGKGKFAEVKRCVKAGALVDGPATIKLTPLLVAIEKGHREIVEYLLNNGADVNCKKTKHAPLHIACQHPKDEEHTADSIAIIEILIAVGADIHASTHRGFSYLHHAALAAHPAYVEHLIKAGLGANVVDEDGDTALTVMLIVELRSHAGKERWHRCISLLIESGGTGWYNAFMGRPHPQDLSQHLSAVYKFTPAELPHFIALLQPQQKALIQQTLLTINRYMPHCEEEIKMHILQAALSGEEVTAT